MLCDADVTCQMMNRIAFSVSQETKEVSSPSLFTLLSLSLTSPLSPLPSPLSPLPSPLSPLPSPLSPLPSPLSPPATTWTNQCGFKRISRSHYTSHPHSNSSALPFPFFSFPFPSPLLSFPFPFSPSSSPLFSFSFSISLDSFNAFSRNFFE